MRISDWSSDVCSSDLTGLGRSGASLMGGEGGLFLEMREAGAKAWFEPAARVWHRIHAERLTKRWMLRRMLFQGMSDCRVERTLKRRTKIHPVSIDLAKFGGQDIDDMDRQDRKSTRLNSSHSSASRMPSSS